MKGAHLLLAMAASLAACAWGDAMWEPVEPEGVRAALPEAPTRDHTVELLLRPDTAGPPASPELEEIDRLLLGARAEDARAALASLLAGRPDAPDVLRRAAVTAFAAGDYQAAAMRFMEWRRIQPDSPEAAAGQCAALLRYRRLDEVAAVLRPVAAKHPHHLLVQYYAVLLRAAGVLEAQPARWQPLRLSLADAQVLASLLAADRADLDRVLPPAVFGTACAELLGEGTHRRLNEARAALTEGAQALQRGDWASVRRELGRAREAGVATLGVRMEHARSLFETGEAAEARAELDALAAEFPGDGPLRYNLGFVLLKMGDAEAAAEALRIALQAMPGHAQAQFALACALAGAGRADEAWAELEPVAARHPDDLRGWMEGDAPYLQALRDDPRVAALLRR